MIATGGRGRRGLAYDVRAFHGAIAADRRKAILGEFTGEFAGESAERPRVLICTDRASRGLDLPTVGHVVLFDFPRDGDHYLKTIT